MKRFVIIVGVIASLTILMLFATRPAVLTAGELPRAGADTAVAGKIREDLIGYAADVKGMALSDAEGGDYLSAEATLKELAKQ